MLKLNLGCGERHKDGWINVDKISMLNPDVILDLEMAPWPWKDNSVGEISLIHVLEHIGPTPDIFLSVIKEMYRVCCDGAIIQIDVPHPRHDFFLNDPTHVRPITPEGLTLFSQESNEAVRRKNGANTPLGRILGVDFKIESVTGVLGHDNTMEEYKITMRAIKPAGKNVK